MPSDQDLSDKHPANLFLTQCLDQLLLAEAPGQQKAAAELLYSQLSKITGVADDAEDALNRRETILSNGRAISPQDAARCVIDFLRTAKFVEGIYRAFSEVQTRFSNRPIEVLYAGCGPFAPFALALANRYRADQVQITLLDVHQHSLAAAARIFQYFGLADRIRVAVCCDAAGYRHSGDQLDIVVLETMQKSLAKEPQVAVTMNLAPQLSAGGILIPEKIVVDVYSVRLAAELSQADEPTARDRIKLGRIFELTSEVCRNEAQQPIQGFAPPSILEIPQEVTPGRVIILATTITIFDSVELCDYESGITYPTVLYNLEEVRPGDRLEFSYQLGTDPGFNYRLLPNS